MKTVDVTEAIRLLKNGEVVAIPTETVYGLGGWIHSRSGLEKIFSTKERPFFDPLIVHVADIKSARELSSEWTEVHEVLAKSCWPGPLTLISRKTDSVDPLITSGLDSVGLRCPDHPETLKLLRQIEGGIAAPSANKFGKTSPTSSAHVFSEFGEEVPVLEGGSSKIGIESTVAGVKKENGKYTVEIYRPGYFTASMLEKILQDHQIKAEVIYSESPVAPGQLKHHYMPKIPLVIVPENFDWQRDQAKVESGLSRKFSSPIHWQLPFEAHMASRELYQKLREFDQQGHDVILVSKLSHHGSEEWKGIWNRLEKAQSLHITD